MSTSVFTSPRYKTADKFLQIRKTGLCCSWAKSFRNHQSFCKEDDIYKGGTGQGMEIWAMTVCNNWTQFGSIGCICVSTTATGSGWSGAYSNVLDKYVQYIVQYTFKINQDYYTVAKCCCKVIFDFASNQCEIIWAGLRLRLKIKANLYLDYLLRSQIRTPPGALPH